MHTRSASFGFALVFILSAAPAQAEILKALRMCPEQQLCPSFELAIEPPNDWVFDQEASEQNGVQIMLPRGRSFGDAPALIYVKISARQDGQSVEDFARVSQERWRQSMADTRIEKMEDVARANGKPAFLSYRYENPSAPQQGFEAVSFGSTRTRRATTMSSWSPSPARTRPRSMRRCRPITPSSRRISTPDRVFLYKTPGSWPVSTFHDREER